MCLAISVCMEQRTFLKCYVGQNWGILHHITYLHFYARVEHNALDSYTGKILII